MTSASPLTAPVLSALRGVSLFSACKEADLHILSRFTLLRFAQPRQILYWQDEPCGAFYLLLRGSVKLTHRSGTGRDKVLEIMEAGEVFGEVGIFSGGGYPTTAVVLEESELLAVQAMPFVRFLQHRPELCWPMLTLLSRRVVKLLREVERLSFYNAEQRVAAYLLEARDGSGAVSATRADLANLLAIAPETLCRILARFQRLGWLRAGNGSMEVERPGELRGVLTRPAPTVRSLSPASVN